MTTTALFGLTVSQGYWPFFSQLSGSSTWDPFTNFCSNRPYLYLIPYPWPLIPTDAIESKKHAANLPKPPFPNPGSGSVSIISFKSIPSSLRPSSISCSTSKFNKLDCSCLPIKNSIEK